MGDEQAKIKTVLVTGANGYIGNAVAKAFVRAGWITYGLVRKESAVSSLAASEIIPIIGSPSSFPSTYLSLHFDVIVSTTEQHPDYITHYEEIITFLRSLATASAGRPLVLFTSGCKDYGMMDALAGDDGLAPHTEESPLNAPSILVDRAKYSMKTFENEDLFDTVLLRPTNVYGGSGSYYGEFFKLSSEAREKGILELSEHPKTILHALHVDDCGDAYVAIASHKDRDAVVGECFNISSHRYETLEEIANALVKEYGIPGGVKWIEGAYGPNESPAENLSRMVLGFSQWTGSEKVRSLGWRDRRILFSEGLRQYRLAYEVAVGEGYKPLDMNTLKLKK